MATQNTGQGEQARRDAQSENDKLAGHDYSSPYDVSAPGDRSNELLSRDGIQSEYGLPRRWLELAALSGNGPPMIRISSRMVRYRRGDFEAWLASRTVTNTSQEVA